MSPEHGDRRDSARRLLPYLAMRINDRVYEVRDWSASGFSLFEADETLAGLAPGEEFHGRFGLSVNREMPFSFSAQVAEIDPARRRYAFSFTRIPLSSFEALQAFGYPDTLPGLSVAQTV